MIAVGELETPEKAKSDRSRCRKCGKKIGQGTPRARMLWKLASIYRSYDYYGWVCYECADEVYENNIESLKKMITIQKRRRTKMRKEIEKSKKEILLHKITDGGAKG